MPNQFNQFINPSGTEQNLQPQPAKKTSLPTWASVLVIVIAAVIAVGIVSWAAYRTFNPLPIGEPTPPTDEPNQTPPDETANWQTYRNELYGYETKYPKDWKTENDTFYSPEVYNMREGGVYSFSINIISPLENINTIEEFINKSEEDCLGNLSYTSIGKYEAIKYSGICEFSSDWFYKPTIPTIIVMATQDKIIQVRSYSIDFNEKDIIDKILSTFKFIEVQKSKEEASMFQKSDKYGFFGTLTLTGYLDIDRWECEPGNMCSQTVDYASFIFKETDNDLINDFLGEYSGNSFVGNKSVGLGCYEKDKKRIISTNDGNNGVFTNIISDNDLEKLLLSNVNNLIKLQLTKPIYTGGRGAPECYSHFRFFKVL